jgi:hypothetical protein
MTTFSQTDAFEGGRFTRVSFKGAQFRFSDFIGVTMRGIDVNGLDIDSHDLAFGQRPRRGTPGAGKSVVDDVPPQVRPVGAPSYVGSGRRRLPPCVRLSAASDSHRIRTCRIERRLRRSLSEHESGKRWSRRNPRHTPIGCQTVLVSR